MTSSIHRGGPPQLTLERLRADVRAGAVDTVVVAFTDIQGRLQGKRLHAAFFLDHVLEHGTEGCNYLLAVDVEMATVEGYEMSSWSTGYGDFAMVPDLETLRPIPWHEGTVLALADLAWHDGSDVLASPRQILRRQLARLAERGWTANAGTELEFIVFNDTYEEAWEKGYRDLTPANLYNVDYSMLGTARIEPLIRRIRNSMMEAGMRVENSKGECNPGQHEINFHYDEALATCDDHVVFKRAAPRRSQPRGVLDHLSSPSTTSSKATPATSTARWPTRRARTSSAPTSSCSITSSPASSPASAS